MTQDLLLLLSTVIARRSFQKQKLLHVCRLINGLNSINPESIILLYYKYSENIQYRHIIIIILIIILIVISSLISIES